MGPGVSEDAYLSPGAEEGRNGRTQRSVTDGVEVESGTRPPDLGTGC